MACVRGEILFKLGVKNWRVEKKENVSSEKGAIAVLSTRRLFTGPFATIVRDEYERRVQKVLKNQLHKRSHEIVSHCYGWVKRCLIWHSYGNLYIVICNVPSKWTFHIQNETIPLNYFLNLCNPELHFTLLKFKLKWFLLTLFKFVYIFIWLLTITILK